MPVQTPIAGMSLVEAELSLLMQIQAVREKEQTIPAVYNVGTLNEDQIHALALDLLTRNDNIMQTVARINYLLENSRG